MEQPRSGPIRVLVVDDSATSRELLCSILASEDGIEVVATARDGDEAVEARERCRPDVVLMDLHMPKLDGLGATRRIMERDPVPIIIVSGTVDEEGADPALEAIAAGALTMMVRPAHPPSAEFEAGLRELVQAVRDMSEVRVVRRRFPRPAPGGLVARPPSDGTDVIVIGASTGGPPIVQELLLGLPARFPLPVLLVQHIAPGFTAGFVEWLGKHCLNSVAEAREGERLTGGRVYVAPDDRHLGVDRSRRVVLGQAPPENGHRPSVSHLFRSVREGFGSRVLAVLLTGMGEDGAAEMKRLRDAGAMTVAQSQDTCAVWGMPGAAIRMGAAAREMSPAQIAHLMRQLGERERGEE